MGCDLPEAKLWSWVDRDAPELTAHLESCPDCRRRAERLRRDIHLISSDLSEVVPLPKQIGNYTVKRLLGEGGQAMVYEAEQSSPRRAVALKVLRGGRFAGRKHIKHFLRETRALASLQHPNIATIYEAGRTEDGFHFFAMELVHGQSLHRHVENNNLERKARLALFCDICNAVEYAHQTGVVHRDLKPANILVNDAGEPKILDFGLAHLTRPTLETTMSLTGTGQMAGTPRYMSPEQVMGRSEDIGPESDVYSLGVILYEMLTGQPPHDAHSFTPETVMSICEEEPQRPSRIDASLKGDLETIVLKALAKDTDRRYGSAADLADDLQRFMERRPIKARPPSIFYTWGKSVSRHRLVGVLAGILVLTALGWVWQALQPPYDMGVARRDVLGMRSELMLANPANRANRHLALNAPERYPGMPEAVLLRALALSAEGENGLALDYLTDRMDMEPDMWPYRALRSELGVVKDPTVAAEFGPWAVKTGGANLAEPWYVRTFTTLDAEQALEWAKTALMNDPEHMLALESVARLSAMTGALQAGLDAASRLLAQGDPRRDFWLAFRCNLLCRLGRPRDALEEIDQALAERPDYARHHGDRAQVNRWLQDYEAAAADYDRAITLMENQGESSGWYRYHRGTPLWILGRLEEAEAEFRDAYHQLARITFGNVRLVLVLRDMGRGTEAAEALAEARRRVGNDAWLNNILTCLAGDISPDELVALADPANAQQRCEGLFYAGEMHRFQGEQAAALEKYRASVGVELTIDRRNFHDRLSEHELAAWRLGQGGVPAPE